MKDKQPKTGPGKRIRDVAYTTLLPQEKEALLEIAVKEHRSLGQQIAHVLSEWLNDRRDPQAREI